jgi:outer membrane lipoprotein carrier protein
MTRTLLGTVAVIFLALTVSYARAGIAAGDAKSIASAFESRYRRARTLRASFLERYSDGGGAVTVESGTAYFSRPGRMRWEYESPEEKLFLVDGKNAWFYVPADHVVSRAKIKESSDWRTPLALLAGSANLVSVCQSLSVVDAEAVPAGAQGEPASSGEPAGVLRCLPKGEADSEVFLRVDSNSWVVRLLIREPGKIETEFRFGNWEEDIAFPPEKFRFQPPPGVAIVNEDSLAGEIR